MGEQTAISWTDHTFNPWWGCEKVSPACAHCYAETFSKRIGLKVWGAESERRFFGAKHWAEPLKWHKAAEKAGVRRRVFCASMADVFEDRPDLEQPRADLFVTISETPQLDWLLLTKRPENIRRFLPPYVSGKDWPNVWLGTTVENQHFANERIPHLLDVPAAVHFISAEPLLGPLDLTHIQETGYDRDALDLNRWQPPWTPNAKIDWVIAGGESGAAYRLSLPEWFRSLRDQCVSAGVAFHFKQWGGRTPKANGRVLDGREWNEFPDGGIERQSDNAVAKGRKVL